MEIPKEIERKFIIKKPETELLSSMPDYTASDITQIYLDSPAGVTHRVRARLMRDKTVYTETKKIRLDEITAYEDEREISKSEFDALSLCIRRGTRKLKKQRHTFSYGAHTVEIDLYPEWQNTAILEVELGSPKEEITLPDFIEVLREVSGIKEYSNAAFASFMPREDA